MRLFILKIMFLCFMLPSQLVQKENPPNLRMSTPYVMRRKIISSQLNLLLRDDVIQVLLLNG